MTSCGVLQKFAATGNQRREEPGHRHGWANSDFPSEDGSSVRTHSIFELVVQPHSLQITHHRDVTLMPIMEALCHLDLHGACNGRALGYEAFSSRLGSFFPPGGTPVPRRDRLRLEFDSWLLGTRSNSDGRDPLWRIRLRPSNSAVRFRFRSRKDEDRRASGSPARPASSLIRRNWCGWTI